MVSLYFTKKTEVIGTLEFGEQHVCMDIDVSIEEKVYNVNVDRNRRRDREHFGLQTRQRSKDMLR